MPPFYGAARVGSVNEFENGCDIARDGACGTNEVEAGQNVQVGVGPWPGGEDAWPVGEHYDRELLAAGDRRNVEDRYRYWTMDAIRADIAARSLPFEVAVENLDHDFNIGAIVRTANAMGARRVHVVGRKRWNRRGAMVTDRYLPVDHCREVADLVEHCGGEGLTLVGVDNVEGSVALESATLPERACLVFGSEASGLSDDMIEACEVVVAITQRGSTRSMNVGHAAAIVMWAHASRLDAAEGS
ncbi:MAG: TrmH family RNA methyltransferase [Schaalia odontolytica]